MLMTAASSSLKRALLVAFLAVVAASLARFAFDPLIGPYALPFITFFPAVAFAAWYSGVRSGVVATALSMVAVSYSFMPPRFQPALASPQEWVGLGLFAGVASIILLISHAYHESRDRAEKLLGEVQAAHLAVQAGRTDLEAELAERKKAERALQQRSEQFETLLNQAPIGVYLVGADFRMRQVNPVARPVFGDIPDLIGRDFDEVIHILWNKEFADAVVRIFRHTLETGESFSTEQTSELRNDRGVVESFEWRTDRIPLPEGGYGVVCYFRDISSLVQARASLTDHQERLRKAEKLAAAGQLAASLAHEINNPLSALLGNAELLLMEKGLTEEQVQQVTVIREQAARIADVVRRLAKLKNPRSVEYLKGSNMLDLGARGSRTS